VELHVAALSQYIACLDSAWREHQYVLTYRLWLLQLESNQCLAVSGRPQ